MTVEELITQMLEGFEGGKRWTQGGLARDACGYFRPPNHPAAETFCLLGMRRRVYDIAQLSRVQRDVLSRAFAARFVATTGVRSISGFNDTQPGFGEVKAALEAAREGGK